jgi:DNA-binding response OmpR family regulator
LEVCRALRADPCTAGVAILIVSGWSFTGDEEAGRRAGAEDYLVKPFSIVDLLARAGVLLTGAHRSMNRNGR